MHNSGSDSPKLLASQFSGNASSFSPLTSAAAAHHAFNLHAAFRSPGFLGAHGFAFSAAANLGNYRDHSPDTFNQHHSTVHNQNSNSLSGSQQNYNTNSNSPTNHQYSPARSNSPSLARDSYLNSDYYHHNNNTTTASAIKAAIESHHNNNSNSEYLTSERLDRLPSNQINNNNTIVNLNNNNHQHQHSHQQQHSHSHQHHQNSVNRRENFDRASSESPETQRCDSSRSFAASQKSDEADYHSPTHPDSVGSRSPENLTSATKTKNNNDMLDHHKLPLSFLGPPLAALHSMTEMKSAAANNVNASSANNNIQQTQSPISSHGTANPHGIDTILSRPPPVTSAGLNALTSGKIHHFFFVIAF